MLHADIQYRTLQPQESRLVVGLHRASFRQEHILHTIYCSASIDKYLAALMTFPALQRQHLLWGAWCDGRLVGYTHARALPGIWHLNYIVVLPQYQGSGVGHALYEQWMEQGRQRGYRRVSLDVDEENERALSWYQRRGLQIANGVWTYERPLQPASGSTVADDPVTLLQWEQAEAWQQSYGFSQFELEYQDRRWSVGRLGESYFRVRTLLPAVLEQTLGLIDPRRRLVMVLEEPLQHTGLVPVARSFRMHGSL